jgi:hypothetical protein
VRSGKKRLPKLPDWVSVVELAEAMHVMPSVVDDEPLEWILRMHEYFYHKYHKTEKVM